MYAFETLAVHAGEEPDVESGALRTPLHMAARYRRKRTGQGDKVGRLHGYCR